MDFQLAMVLIAGALSLIGIAAACSMLPAEKIQPVKTYKFRFEAHDRYGVRRIFDNELKKYIDDGGITPELISRWNGNKAFQSHAIRIPKFMKVNTLSGLTIEVTEIIDRTPCRHQSGVTLDTYAEFEQYICNTCQERLHITRKEMYDYLP